MRYHAVKDRTYVAYRRLDYKELYYYDVIYVKHKGTPMHSFFVSNIEEDPYSLAETYRSRWQIEEGFKTRKARIELIRGLCNKLFLIYALLDTSWNLYLFLSFNFKALHASPLTQLWEQRVQNTTYVNVVVLDVLSLGQLRPLCN
ncbi:hypothetical protein HS7_10830 [Sulfolobales archaeon HS-7]|nr:hypothetical protein HS7_10830 [Sulfolobales archaeon HS-7]